MSTNNPQDKYMKVSKKFVIAQDFLGFITLVLAIFQGITLVIPVLFILIKLMSYER